MEGKFKGIRIIGIADLVFGFCLLAYLLYCAISFIFDFKKCSMGINIVSLVLLIIFFLIGVGLIKVGFLTLKLNSKAIRGNVIFAVLVIMSCLGSFLQYQSRASELLKSFFLIYCVWLIFYLNRPKVKEQFK